MGAHLAAALTVTEEALFQIAPIEAVDVTESLANP
jgi:hypothetical protein